MADAKVDVKNTYRSMCCALRKDDLVVLKGRPCKIVKISTPKTDKDGHDNVHFVGIDVFSGKKYEDICPFTQYMEVPVVKIIDYKLTGIHAGYLTLLHDSGEVREDVKIPENEMGRTIASSNVAGDEVVVTVRNVMDEGEVVGIDVVYANPQPANPMDAFCDALNLCLCCGIFSFLLSSFSS